MQVSIKKRLRSYEKLYIFNVKVELINYSGGPLNKLLLTAFLKTTYIVDEFYMLAQKFYFK